MIDLSLKNTQTYQKYYKEQYGIKGDQRQSYRFHVFYSPPHSYPVSGSSAGSLGWSHARIKFYNQNVEEEINVEIEM